MKAIKRFLILLLITNSNKLQLKSQVFPVVETISLFRRHPILAGSFITVYTLSVSQLCSVQFLTHYKRFVKLNIHQDGLLLLYLRIYQNFWFKQLELDLRFLS